MRAKSPVTPKITMPEGPAMRGRRLSFALRNGLTHALVVLTKCPFGLCEVSPTAQHSDTRPANDSCLFVSGARVTKKG